jgi:hypothetical protein
VTILLLIVDQFIDFEDQIVASWLSAFDSIALQAFLLLQVFLYTMIQMSSPTDQKVFLSELRVKDIKIRAAGEWSHRDHDMCALGLQVLTVFAQATTAGLLTTLGANSGFLRMTGAQSREFCRIGALAATSWRSPLVWCFILRRDLRRPWPLVASLTQHTGVPVTKKMVKAADRKAAKKDDKKKGK